MAFKRTAMSTATLMAAEVAWYRQHGENSDRIRRTTDGHEYVVGDFSWNQANPFRQEFIEARMASEIITTMAFKRTA